MGETDLAEIESRLEAYPRQARHDILRLTRELRRLYAGESQKSALEYDSPLYDALTGLLNAGAYGVRFAMARARATRYRKIFAVMSVDVSFAPKSAKKKAVGAADREHTMREVAGRLEGCVRATDTLARIGETNFAVILEDLSEPGHVDRVRQNVETTLAQPVRLDGREIAAVSTVRMQFYPQPDARKLDS